MRTKVALLSGRIATGMFGAEPAVRQFSAGGGPRNPRHPGVMPRPPRGAPGRTHPGCCAFLGVPPPGGGVLRR